MEWTSGRSPPSPPPPLTPMVPTHSKVSFSHAREFLAIVLLQIRRDQTPPHQDEEELELQNYRNKEHPPPV